MDNELLILKLQIELLNLKLANNMCSIQKGSSQIFLKIGVLKISQYSLENTCVWVCFW